ncbi:MAG: 2-phospho-L-lactate guanylyltransferase [Steroidobacteraceae bacterium]
MTDTKCWAVIAIKGPGQRKVRLAGVLGRPERDLLALEMFRHVFETTSALFGPGRILVVSPGPVPMVGAAATLRDDGSCLNAAFDLGRRRAFAAGAGKVLLLPADLPALQGADLQAVLNAGLEASVVLAPACAGGGTNGLLLDRTARSFPLAFGPGSFSAHRRAALARALSWQLVRRAGLEADVDHPADLDLPLLARSLASARA